VSVECRVPEVYTLDEVHRLLEVAQHEPHRTLMAYVTLGLFAGLRPTEAQRLTWNDFHWDHSVLSISPDRTKVKRARLVELHSVLLDWLNRVPRDRPLIPSGFPDVSRVTNGVLRFGGFPTVFVTRLPPTGWEFTRTGTGWPN
jgi:integrase